jgi:predicted DNA-binding transcriptional regulator AlpA
MFDHLPDDAIITPSATSHLTGLSEDTQKRQSDRGKFPARIQLSKRRFGYRLGDIRAWLRARAAAAPAKASDHASISQ